MQMHRVATHGNLAGQIHFAVDFRAVVAVGEAIDSVGNRGDAGTHFALGVIQQRGAGSQHRCAAVLRA